MAMVIHENRYNGSSDSRTLKKIGNFEVRLDTHLQHVRFDITYGLIGMLQIQFAYLLTYQLIINLMAMLRGR